MRYSILSALLLSVSFLQAQDATSSAKAPLPNVHQFLDLTGGIGDNQGSIALSYVHNWGLGKNKKFEMGLGARFTSYFGSNQFFQTAPAKLTSGKTGLGVLFSDDIPENIDTVFFNKAQINALNISLNFGYHVTRKLLVGFNIDAIGFSFGERKRGTYFDGNNLTPPEAEPTSFNLLLTSDNDLGSLNSEFFATYAIGKRLSGKLGYEFLFTEYTTTQEIQTTPDGQKNDRFRNKVSALALGFTYKL